MSARERLFGFVEAGAEEEDLPAFASALDAYRDEILADAAESLSNHRISGLSDTVLNILTTYGFFNPANAVPELEKTLAAFRRHLLAMRKAPAERPCGCTVRFERHLDSCPTVTARRTR
jgi:hypothetical protein